MPKITPLPFWESDFSTGPEGTAPVYDALDTISDDYDRSREGNEERL